MTEALLSNLAHTPFEMDGMRYASVEAFWQGLKYSDTAKRDEIATYHGLASKKSGDEWDNEAEFVYLGQRYDTGSREHQELMYRALRAKLEQHPDILALLLATGDTPIIHKPVKKDGTPYPDSITIPADIFAGYLMRLRSKLGVSGQVDETRESAISLL
jgi:predicted NAD-dependent protein-ADP-ribosyltransferase YbiA (DUF1768 family)